MISWFVIQQKLMLPVVRVTFEMRASKFGSGLSERLETSFLRQVGHSLLLHVQNGSL